MSGEGDSPRIRYSWKEPLTPTLSPHPPSPEGGLRRTRERGEGAKQMRNASIRRALRRQPTGLASMISLKICTIIIVAVAMDMALAHALELPGKLRLPK